MKTRSAGITAKITDYGLADSDTDKESGDPVEDDHSDNDDYDFPPPKKSRKSCSGTSKGWKNSRSSIRKVDKLYRGRHVGKLANMLQMPLDIFCEIAVHLEPLDLLYLARSSRSLNNLLMSRSSKPIWRAARSNIDGLPDCPSDLSEPAYARLIFDKYCHICVTARVSRADFVLRARLCQRCTKSKIVKESSLFESIPGLPSKLLSKLLRCVPCRQNNHRRGPRYKYFHIEQVKAVFEEFKSLIPENLPEAERKSLKTEFYDRRKQLVKATVEHGASLERWMTSYLDRIEIQRVDTARRREASITAKLLELGYETSDFPNETEMELREWEEIMNQPRDLTPRIWIYVRPKLEAFIKSVKIARENLDRQWRERERRAEIWTFMDSLIDKRAKKDKELFMTFDEASRLPTVVALAGEDDFTKVVTQQRWDAAVSLVEKDMDEFADYARNYLTGLIRASLPSSSGSASSVSRAPASTSADSENGDFHDSVSLNTAYFHCDECGWSYSLMKYPALLGHYHSLKSMSFNATHTKYAKLLLPFLGSVNEDKLFSLGRQLQCLQCDEDCTRPMSWSSLIVHFELEQQWYDELLHKSEDSSLVKVKLHNDHDINNWSLDTPAYRILNYDVAKSLELRVDEMVRQAWNQGRYWSCALCTWGLKVETSQKKVESHIRRKHLKEPEPKDMLDYRWESDSS